MIWTDFFNDNDLIITLKLIPQDLNLLSIGKTNWRASPVTRLTNPKPTIAELTLQTFNIAVYEHLIFLLRDFVKS